jgi:hypothetical protein
MEDYGEDGIPDFLRFMEGHLQGEFDVEGYRRGVFALNKRRATFTEDEFCVLQLAFHDADDFDAVMRLNHTILEPELTRRVAKSIIELVELGREAVRVDTQPSSA